MFKRIYYFKRVMKYIDIFGYSINIDIKSNYENLKVNLI